MNTDKAQWEAHTKRILEALDDDLSNLVDYVVTLQNGIQFLQRNPEIKGLKAVIADLETLQSRFGSLAEDFKAAVR